MRVMGELGGLGVLGELGELGRLLPHQHAALWRYAARQIRLGFSFIGLFVWFLRLGCIF